MNKILICLGIGTSLIAMDKNPHTNAIEIPGALKSSEGHSPTEYDSAIQSARLVHTYATHIALAATQKLTGIYASGKKPGSPEVTNQLLAEYKLLKEQDANNKKDKKSKEQKEKNKYQTNQITASIDACILHVATTINEGIAFQNQKAATP